MAQTYKEIEILLIDDGSTDNSGNICDDYAQKDLRIKVYHKTNGGLSDARNYGIDKANGDFVAFIDGDDYIHPQMIEILANVKEQTQAELVACNFERLDESLMQVKYAKDDIGIEIISGADALISPNKPKVVAWNKLYDRAMFKNVRYPVNRYHEDEFIIHEILYQCKKVAIIEQKLYFYVTRGSSIMETMTPQRIYDALEGLEKRCQFCYEKSWNEVMPAVIERYCEYCVSYYFQIKDGKYAKLHSDIIELLLNSEREILKKYKSVNVAEKYKMFAENPVKYENMISKQQRKQEIKESILYILRKGYHAIKKK